MRFFDTNILVYTQSDGDPRKKEIACDIVAEAIESGGDACISTQVLQEFCNTMRRKTHRSTSEINALLDYFSDLWRCDISKELAREALSVQDEYGISYYDALIVATAEKLGCTQILTEDLNDGQTYRGMVAVNPFKTHANTEPNALVDFSSNQ